MGPPRERDGGEGRCPLQSVLAGALLSLLMAAHAADAQRLPGDMLPSRQLDFLIDRHEVSGPFGDWSSAIVRLVLPSAPDARMTSRTVWHAEGVWRRAFRDEGSYAGVGVQRAFTPDWLARLSIGGGSGAFIFPDARVDASLSRAWLSRRQLVTTIGGSMIDAKRGYREQGVTLSTALYATPILVVEGGGRWNRSTPGDVTSARAYGAITLGSDRRRYIVARGATGDEGYQLVGPAAPLVKFTSHEASLSWREWFGRRWGLVVQAERYTNPHYERTGVTSGVFVHW